MYLSLQFYTDVLDPLRVPSLDGVFYYYKHNISTEYGTYNMSETLT